MRQLVTAARRCAKAERDLKRQADFETTRSFVARDDDEQARGGAEAPVPEFSVVFRFRAYSRRYETEPERAFHRKMCSGQEVAGHAGFFLIFMILLLLRDGAFFFFIPWKPTDTRPRDRCGRAQLVLLPSLAVQRQSAVQRVAKIGILERGPSLGRVELQLHIFR